MTKEQPFSGTFKLDKETKNTVRYAEEAEGRSRLRTAWQCRILNARASPHRMDVNARATSITVTGN